MEKEFIPYKQALALKELGFDEPCFGFYEKEILKPTSYVNDFYHGTNHGVDFENIFKTIPAPTFSQVFRWFRDKYGLISYIQTSYVTHEVVNNRNIPCTPRIEFTFGITNTIGKSIFSSFKQGSFKTYE